MKWRRIIVFWVICLIFGFVIGVTPSFAEEGYKLPRFITNTFSIDISGTLVEKDMSGYKYNIVVRDKITDIYVAVVTNDEPYLFKEVNNGVDRYRLEINSGLYIRYYKEDTRINLFRSDGQAVKVAGEDAHLTNDTEIVYSNFDLKLEDGSVIHPSDGNAPTNEWGNIKFPINNSNVTGYPDIVFHVNSGYENVLKNLFGVTDPKLFASITVDKIDAEGKVLNTWYQPYCVAGVQGPNNCEVLTTGQDITLSKAKIPYNGNGKYRVMLMIGNVNKETNEFEHHLPLSTVVFTIGGSEENSLIIAGIEEGDTFTSEPTCTIYRKGTYLKNQYQLFINGKLDSTINAGKSPAGPQGYDVNGFHTFGFKVGSNTIEIKDMQGNVVKKVTFTIATGGVDIDPETGNPTNGVDPDDVKNGKPIRPDGSLNPLDWIIYFFDIIGYYIDSLVSGIGKLITSLTTNGGAISNFVQKVFTFLPSPMPELLSGSIVIMILLKVFKR